MLVPPIVVSRLSIVSVKNKKVRGNVNDAKYIEFIPCGTHAIGYSFIFIISVSINIIV